MSEIDGPTLRALRESLGVPLRAVARRARVSHGHLSKVERGEYGRPITPAIIAAYEKAAGTSLQGLLEGPPGEPAGVLLQRLGERWRPARTRRRSGPLMRRSGWAGRWAC